MKWGLKGGISIDADSGPLRYVLWCCGSICHQLFTFIQIYSGHTVWYLNCLWDQIIQQSLIWIIMKKKFYSTSTIMWFLGIYDVGIKDAKNHHLPIQLASWHSKKKCVHCSVFTFVELQASFPFVDFWSQISIFDPSRIEF